MTGKETLKDFFCKVICPAMSAYILFYIFSKIFTNDGVTNYFMVALCCGVPFGIRRMCMWLIPGGYGIAGTVGVWALNFIVGGIIGIMILAWRLLTAVLYIGLTIYRIIILIRVKHDSVYFETV